jgi:hypothetical protein
LKPVATRVLAQGKQIAPPTPGCSGWRSWSALARSRGQFDSAGLPIARVGQPHSKVTSDEFAECHDVVAVESGQPSSQLGRYLGAAGVFPAGPPDEPRHRPTYGSWQCATGRPGETTIDHPVEGRATGQSSRTVPHGAVYRDNLCNPEELAQPREETDGIRNKIIMQQHQQPIAWHSRQPTLQMGMIESMMQDWPASRRGRLMDVRRLFLDKVLEAPVLDALSPPHHIVRVAAAGWFAQDGHDAHVG